MVRLRLLMTFPNIAVGKCCSRFTAPNDCSWVGGRGELGGDGCPGCAFLPNNFSSANLYLTSHYFSSFRMGQRSHSKTVELLPVKQGVSFKHTHKHTHTHIVGGLAIHTGIAVALRIDWLYFLRSRAEVLHSFSPCNLCA